MIDELQRGNFLWAKRNFPDTWKGNDITHPILGCGEEVGEMMHAWLKYQQNIRGMDQGQMEEKVKDAIGDLFQYMLDICNRMGWSMETIVAEVAFEVSQRNWIEDRQQGGVAGKGG